MIEVFVESIRVNMTNYRRVVMLKEKTSPRYLPIWIGHFEADAIAIPMQNVPVQRPLTHDLLKGVIEQLGAPQEVYDRPASVFVADGCAPTARLAWAIPTMAGIPRRSRSSGSASADRLTAKTANSSLASSCTATVSRTGTSPYFAVS